MTGGAGNEIFDRRLSDEESGSLYDTGGGNSVSGAYGTGGRGMRGGNG